MALAVRFLKDGDIQKVNSWLEGWNQFPLKESVYPPTGLVMYDDDDGGEIYMGFVWMTNSSLAQIGFITRNPFYKKKQNKQTRKTFISALISYAKELGYEQVMTWAENEFLKQDFRELGLTETSNRVSEFKNNF